MAAGAVPFLALALAFLSSFAAADPDPLQDTCVADLKSELKVNGFVCKRGKPDAADFFFSGLAEPVAVNKTTSAVATAANVEKIPGLNTLGLSVGRIDFAPGGLNPPHTHPRATEIIFVLEGELSVGFITTANELVDKALKKGDVFVFPKGLVHFQKNTNAKKNASVLSAFNSQLPGTQSIARTLFATDNPAVPNDVLAGAFKIGDGEVQHIKKQFKPKN